MLQTHAGAIIDIPVFSALVSAKIKDDPIRT